MLAVEASRTYQAIGKQRVELVVVADAGEQEQRVQVGVPALAGDLVDRQNDQGLAGDSGLAADEPERLTAIGDVDHGKVLQRWRGRFQTSSARWWYTMGACRSYQG
ncbi:hypothetical protein [Catenulispora subtropica]|uniref:hypothetical protein n=1 Tax=Catenulispora subtropica TaxID=450798 RepID=UPI0031E2980F